MRLLRSFSKSVNGRHDVKLSFEKVAPALVVQHYMDGPKLHPKAGSTRKADENLSYDINVLLEDRLIEFTHMKYVNKASFAATGVDPALTVTRKGLSEAATFSKSWLRKSIDKQPITFINILVTLLLSGAAFVGGLITERHFINIDEPTVSPIIHEQPVEKAAGPKGEPAV